MFFGSAFRRFALSAQIAGMSLVLAACNAPSMEDGQGTSSASSARSRSIPSSSQSSASGGTVSSAAGVTENRYMDGTYAATGDYRSPNGAESVNVTLVLADGVVTDAQFKGNATHEISSRMQGNFAAAFEAEVIGKSIDDLNLTVVNGSSLTSGGFMDAVEKIKVEAMAS